MPAGELAFADAKAALDAAAGVGHGVAEYPEKDGNDRVNFLLCAQPVRVGEDSAGDAEQVEDADKGDQGRVFEEADELPDENRDDRAQGPGAG